MWGSRGKEEKEGRMRPRKGFHRENTCDQRRRSRMEHVDGWKEAEDWDRFGARETKHRNMKARGGQRRVAANNGDEWIDLIRVSAGGGYDVRPNYGVDRDDRCRLLQLSGSPASRIVARRCAYARQGTRPRISRFASIAPEIAPRLAGLWLEGWPRGSQIWSPVLSCRRLT